MRFINELQDMASTLSAEHVLLVPKGGKEQKAKGPEKIGQLVKKLMEKPSVEDRFASVVGKITPEQVDPCQRPKLAATLLIPDEEGRGFDGQMAEDFYYPSDVKFVVGQPVILEMTWTFYFSIDTPQGEVTVEISYPVAFQAGDPAQARQMEKPTNAEMKAEMKEMVELAENNGPLATHWLAHSLPVNSFFHNWLPGVQELHIQRIQGEVLAELQKRYPTIAALAAE